MSTRWRSGWGLKFFAYDNDGDLDLFLSNGFPDDLVEEFSKQVTHREPLLLFHHEGRVLGTSAHRPGQCLQSLSSRVGRPSGILITTERWTR
jgi:hypothetical protein